MHLEIIEFLTFRPEDKRGLSYKMLPKVMMSCVPFFAFTNVLHTLLDSCWMTSLTCQMVLLTTLQKVMYVVPVRYKMDKKLKV